MIWVIGAGGMLGTEVSAALGEAGLEAVGTGREPSILDPAALAAFARERGPSWIVNCAAYTDVDGAEGEAEEAAGLNALGPENLGRLAAQTGARVIHVSTDYVFDGRGKRPYVEDDPPAPLGVYGRTKAEGEARLGLACPEHVILRTAWLYGRRGRNFVTTMLGLMATRERLGVVADQRGSPTWTADLAAAIVSVLGSPEPRYGTFHYVDRGEASWYEFAREIQARAGALGFPVGGCALEAIPASRYPTRARRPDYSVLSTDRIRRDYLLDIPAWQASLGRFLGLLAAQGYDPGH